MGAAGRGARAVAAPPRRRGRVEQARAVGPRAAVAAAAAGAGGAGAGGGARDAAAPQRSSGRPDVCERRCREHLARHPRRLRSLAALLWPAPLQQHPQRREPGGRRRRRVWQLPHAWHLDASAAGAPRVSCRALCCGRAAQRRRGRRSAQCGPAAVAGRGRVVRLWGPRRGPRPPPPPLDRWAAGQRRWGVRRGLRVSAAAATAAAAAAAVATPVIWRGKPAPPPQQWQWLRVCLGSAPLPLPAPLCCWGRRRPPHWQATRRAGSWDGAGQWPALLAGRRCGFTLLCRVLCAGRRGFALLFRVLCAGRRGRRRRGDVERQGGRGRGRGGRHGSPLAAPPAAVPPHLPCPAAADRHAAPGLGRGACAAARHARHHRPQARP